MKHGKGKWRSNKDNQNCNTYDGEYANDLKQGYGVFKWTSGNIYEGEYFEDERHGHGAMTWTEGSCYEGDWIKGI